MLSDKEIKTKAEKKYNAFLSHTIQEEPFFPLDIPFGRSKLAKNYTSLQTEVNNIKKGSKATTGYGYTITWATRNTRTFGTQTLPSRVYFATEEDFLRFIGKKKEAAQFKTAVSQTLTRYPQLRPWLIQYPQRLIKHLPIWTDLLAVCASFIANPRPNCYMRQLPVAVHTKFVETHQQILRHLLDELLPAEAINHKEETFTARFYLRDTEPLFRLRLLDTELQHRLNWPSTDLALPLSTLQTLDLSPYELFIVENKMTFLTLPNRPRSIALWGHGFTAVSLGRLTWLENTAVYYWGDIDVQGFEILSGLRAHHPHVQAWLMNQSTLDHYHDYLVRGTASRQKEPPSHLTTAETELYHHLQKANLRLEQENIDQQTINQTMMGTFTIKKRH